MTFTPDVPTTSGLYWAHWEDKPESLEIVRFDATETPEYPHGQILCHGISVTRRPDGYLFGDKIEPPE